MKYRNEIDGLRALAILPVVFYHAGFPLFSGGFIGVDIFFVISGFLISSIVIEELENNRFSYANFYERRFRRILPALFLVSITSFIVGWFSLPPTDMQDFSKSLVRAFLFISNVYFYNHSGYFDSATELKPLIHSWSLSVEEQFYIFLPVFLTAISIFRNYLKIAISIVVIFASLITSQILINSNPDAAFYLLHSRLWELMLGVLLRLLLNHHSSLLHNITSSTQNLLGLIGILLIVVPIFCFTPDTAFPGISALPATLGALLIIAYARDDTIAGRLLRNKTLAYIGLISYSTYLWHQPIFSFARHLSTNSVTTFQSILLIGLTLCLSSISWRFIELPFRKSRSIGTKVIWIGTITVSLSALLAGNLGSTDGFKSRFSKAYEEYPSALGVRNKDYCNSNIIHIDGLDLCFFGDLSSTNRIALWGDSHASMLLEALNDQFLNKKIMGVRIIFKKCGPIPSIQLAASKYAMAATHEKCLKEYDKAYKYVSNNTVGTIVSIRWSYHLYPIVGHIDKMHFDNKEGGIEPGKSKAKVAYTESANFSIGEIPKIKALQDFIDQLSSGKSFVLILEPVPEVGWDIPRTNLKHIILNNSPVLKTTITTSYQAYIDRNNFIISFINSLSKPNIFQVHSSDVFCNNLIKNRCVAQSDGISYYTDTNHLSTYGANMLAPKIMDSVPTIFSQ
jgi:peptidoglycan/LPS O-acetylase OafA/YrhL